MVSMMSYSCTSYSLSALIGCNAAKGCPTFWLSCEIAHFCIVLHANTYAVVPLEAKETIPCLSSSLLKMAGVALLNMPRETVNGVTIGVARPADAEMLSLKTKDCLVVTTKLLPCPISLLRATQEALGDSHLASIAYQPHRPVPSRCMSPGTGPYSPDPDSCSPIP